jgi:hypothetical protein
MAVRHKIKKHIIGAYCHVGDHFVPCERNEYRPYLFKHRVLFGYSIILILLKALVVLGPVALPSSSLYSSAITPQNVVDLTNQARKNLELPRLASNKKLMAAASAKAADMVANQYFAHTSPDGRKPWDWIKGSGYTYLYAGENLAVHFHEAEDVQAGWMASPSHRANIVNNRYTEIGVGVATGTFEGVKSTFVVQMFGRPTTTLATTAPTDTTGLTQPSIEQPSGGEVAGSSAASGITVKPVDPDALSIDADTILSRPTKNGYYVSVAVKNAVSAAVVLSDVRTPLQVSSEGDRWHGEIAVDASQISEAGEPLLLVATDNKGEVQTKSLVLAAPSTSTQKLFTFNEGVEKFTTFFGFLSIGNLDDSVRRFYIGFVVFLAAAMLINLFVLKLRIRHPSVATHAMLVMVLAVFLALV